MSKKKILLVEDEDSIRDSVEIYLTHSGYEVIAYDRYESVLPNETADVYLLDNNNRNGINGVDWIKQFGHNVPVQKRLLMSGLDGWSGIECKLFIPKPFNLGELVDIIEASEVKENEI